MIVVLLLALLARLGWVDPVLVALRCSYEVRCIDDVCIGKRVCG